MTLSQDPPRTVKPTPTLVVKPDYKPGMTAASTPVYLPGTACLIKPQVSLANLTSFRVGGPAEWYVAPRQVEELQASVLWAAQEGLSVTILGAGSNVLLSDRGLPGLVVGTRHLRQIEFDEATGQLTAGAGEPIAKLAWLAAERGWQGLEWAVGIPGTLGGSLVMNAGAHGECMADILVSAQVLGLDGSLSTVGWQEMQFSYRTSILQKQRRLVSQVTLQLKPGADPAQVTAVTQDHLDRRKSTQPYHLPSCGSVFRNPTPHSAGWLIEQSGLKGYQIGGAQVAQRHANFILNCGGAKASEILQLIRFVQDQVLERWSMHLEPEVKIIGEF